MRFFLFGVHRNSCISVLRRVHGTLGSEAIHLLTSYLDRIEVGDLTHKVRMLTYLGR
jgi:hypothetical protein